MNKTVGLSFVIAFLASIVAGCGSSGTANVATTSTPTPLPSPTATCTPPAGYTIQEVFPQNGASAAPNLQGVVFAIGPSPQPGSGSPSPLPTNWYIYAYSPAYGSTNGTNSIGFLNTPAPSPSPLSSASAAATTTPTPLPTPSDSPKPGFTNYLYETASLGTFATSTKWTIYLANASCSPGIQESTFTTSDTDQPTATPSPSST